MPRSDPEQNAAGSDTESGYGSDADSECGHGPETNPDSTLRTHLRSALDTAEDPAATYHIRQALQLLDVE